MEVVMKRNSESGQALVFTALGLVCLLGFVGLGVDMGMLRYEKRLQQTAADAAAIAAATNLTLGGVQAAGLTASGANGFTDNTGGGACANSNNAAVGDINVTICNGPQALTINGVAVPAGPHNGNLNYVEAVVTVVQPTYFMKIFGKNKETVIARAVATNYSGATKGTSNYNCLITLGPPSSSIEGVNINGAATLNAPTCGVSDDGNYNTQGNALVVKAGSFGVSGNKNVSGPGGSVTCYSGQTNCPEYGVTATPDPLASLTPPCSPCTSTGSISISGPGTYIESPGTYSSITIDGTGKKGAPTVTFSPGVYVVTGGNFTLKGNASLIGNGVMFYFTNGATFNATGGGNVLDIQFTPPTTGKYQGILIYQDPKDSSGPSLGGDNNSNFGGIIYTPGAQLTFFGNNVTYATGMVIADSVSLSGSPIVNLQGQAGLPGGALPPALTVGTATLVE
jgi:Flp pilus assembly protein TadG